MLKGGSDISFGYFFVVLGAKKAKCDLICNVTVQQLWLMSTGLSYVKHRQTLPQSGSNKDQLREVFAKNTSLP